MYTFCGLDAKRRIETDLIHAGGDYILTILAILIDIKDENSIEMQITNLWHELSTSSYECVLLQDLEDLPDRDIFPTSTLGVVDSCIFFPPGADMARSRDPHSWRWMMENMGFYQKVEKIDESFHYISNSFSFSKQKSFKRVVGRKKVKVKGSLIPIFVSTSSRRIK
ncbi:hypothetical protein CR513_20728, partial [Mucuna pruriens]